jgi:hypothetical protein
VGGRSPSPASIAAIAAVPAAAPDKLVPLIFARRRPPVNGDRLYKIS